MPILYVFEPQDGWGEDKLFVRSSGELHSDTGKEILRDTAFGSWEPRFHDTGEMGS